jgi:hypothetical protein
VVSPFTINLSKRTDGVITGSVTQLEKVLITSRATDTLSIPETSGYRGFDGTSTQEFAANDFVTIEVDQSYFDGLKALISLVYQNFPTNTEACLVTGNQTVAGVKTFSSFPVTPSSAPTTNYQTANKKYVDDEINAIQTSFYYQEDSDTGGVDYSTLTTSYVLYDTYTVPSDKAIVMKEFSFLFLTGTGTVTCELRKNGTPISTISRSTSGTETDSTLNVLGEEGDVFTIYIKASVGGSFSGQSVEGSFWKFAKSALVGDLTSFAK